MDPRREHLPAQKVYLVGAGPGDPGLITVRGLECLKRAQVVLYDCLVNPALLNLAPAEAELVAVDPPDGGRHASGACRGVSRLEQAIQRKGIIVYLKGGDPEVFSRSGPELEALRRAGVPFEVVPGVTAALAAAAYAGIPVTHVHHSSAVALVAGKQSSQQAGPGLDYAGLARFPGTLVFYMALETVGDWVPALLAAGKSPQTPAAIVQRVSWPDQQTFRCTLGELAQVVAQGRVREPSVVVIGEVVGLAGEPNWFTSRPLFGRRVLLTRPEAQARGMADQLTELGAEVLFQPAIRIAEPPDWGPVDEVIERIAAYDWVVFSSVNGVSYFLRRLWDRQRDVRALGRSRLAAIGPATAAALEEWHLRPELVPREYRAEDLAETLIGWKGANPAPGWRILLLRASRGREVLAERLAQAGAMVDQVVVYTSADVEQPDPAVVEALAAGRIDWVTITSSAIARCLVSLLGENLRRARLASISPVTSQVLRELGFSPAAEARTYTTDGLLEAILAHERQAQGGETSREAAGGG